jgi:hypothetical protein
MKLHVRKLVLTPGIRPVIPGISPAVTVVKLVKIFSVKTGIIIFVVLF